MFKLTYSKTHCDHQFTTALKCGFLGSGKLTPSQVKLLWKASGKCRCCGLNFPACALEKTGEPCAMASASFDRFLFSFQHMFNIQHVFKATGEASLTLPSVSKGSAKHLIKKKTLS